MSQTTLSAAPGQIAPGQTPQAPPVAHRGTIGARVRDLVAGTPGSMRVFAVITTVVLLLFGAFGALAVRGRATAVSHARADAAQLVRIQTVRTNLVQADANATNSFLVGGLAPPAQRASYAQAIATASATIAAASGQSSSDARTLSHVNDDLTQYTGLIEAARANNRQGFAVGAAYLESASSLLRTDVLPALSGLVTVNEARVQSDYTNSNNEATVLWTLAVIALVVLLVAQGWMAMRTRRWFNIGLAAATAGVLVSVAAGGAVMLWAQYRADHVHTGAYRATVALAQARIDGFDAKSAESLTLIFRGSGQAFETEFVQVSADATSQLASTTAQTSRQAYAAYLLVHAQIRKLDDGGNWDQAVALATGNAADGSNVTFQTFDRASAAALDTQAARIDHDLHSARTPLLLAAWLVLAAGIVAAIAAGRGVAVRLREYR